MFTPIRTIPLYDGFVYRYRFPNGYGASVARHRNSYGGADKLWEVAVIRYDGPNDNDWDFDQSDILGDNPIDNLNDQQKENALMAISQLEDPTPTLTRLGFF